MKTCKWEENLIYQVVNKPQVRQPIKLGIIKMIIVTFIP